MKEELLHFIWQSKLLLHQPLTTTDGEPIEVVHTGTINLNAGPDFLNAKVRIAGTLWAGNIEIHWVSSDWNSHNHQHDTSYNNVILHVVYDHNKKVQNQLGETLNTLELRGYLPTTLLKRYQLLQANTSKQIACANIFVKPNDMILQSWLQRLLIERIEHKCIHLQDLLLKTENHWEQCFYVYTARYFGMKINGQPFEQLATLLPISMVSKYKHNFESILALYIGTAGLFEKFPEEFKGLRKEYEHLKSKHNLTSMVASQWKFARTRPANFPTERIPQFASFVFHSNESFLKIFDSASLNEVKSNYTKSTEFKGVNIAMGESSIDLLLMNSLLPFMFMYGKIQHREDYMDKALNWYTGLKPEQNTITKQFQVLGLNLENAGDSQAYIQLKNEYCNTLRCLHCSIGYQSLLHA